MAASAPAAASGVQRTAKATAETPASPKDSREKLLRELKQGTAETNNSGQPPANLQFDHSTLVGAAAQPTTKAIDERLQLEQEMLAKSRSEPSSQARETQGHGVTEDSWLRAAVKYLRENRNWLAAMGAGTLVLAAMLSFAFRRAARPQRGLAGSDAREAARQAEQSSAQPIPQGHRRRRTRRLH